MNPERALRRSARAILLSPANEVLLIKFEVARAAGPFIFWATPGGEVEANESDLDAAAREIREELGLTLVLHGPVHSDTAEFEHNGQWVRSTDLFFVGRCERDAPRLQAFTEAERKALREARWWSIQEIETTSETVFPKNFAHILAGLARN